MRYPCPSCGHLVFEESPGSYDICSICFWEDDDVQLRWPDMAGGANMSSLIESQRNFAEFGAVERRSVEYVRPARDDEEIERGWRTIDLSVDKFEPIGVHDETWPDDKTVLYYWRPTFWKRPAAGPPMARADSLTDADAQYLADIWRDCQRCLAPGTELLDLRRETTDEGVRLVALYRLGRHDRESAAIGETLLAAHSALRDRIIIDRIRFGFSDLVEGR